MAVPVAVSLSSNRKSVNCLVSPGVFATTQTCRTRATSLREFGIFRVILRPLSARPTQVLTALLLLHDYCRSRLRTLFSLALPSKLFKGYWHRSCCSYYNEGLDQSILMPVR